ncbi:MAG TPA: hypothetical protein DCQ31_15815 [Bacteroidales bacterium]|nr:hypothetical protein [Bacteroidales bacterium]
MKTTILLLLVTFAGANACTNSELLKPEISLKSDTVKYKLKGGETLYFENSKLTLMFDSIASDSRCPIGVHCIWAGEVVAVFKINEQTYNLRPGEELKFEHFKLKLVDVFPYPEAGMAIKQTDYTIEFFVFE